NHVRHHTAKDVNIRRRYTRIGRIAKHWHGVLYRSVCLDIGRKSLGMVGPIVGVFALGRICAVRGRGLVAGLDSTAGAGGDGVVSDVSGGTACGCLGLFFIWLLFVAYAAIWVCHRGGRGSGV